MQPERRRRSGKIMRNNIRNKQNMHETEEGKKRKE